MTLIAKTHYYFYKTITMKTKAGPLKSKSSLDKKFQLADSERRFRRACEQIVQLNYKLDELQCRYLKAKRENMRTFRYSLRLRLAVVEGLRNTYYDYAHQKAETVAELRQELFGEDVDIVLQ